VTTSKNKISIQASSLHFDAASEYCALMISSLRFYLCMNSNPEQRQKCLREVGASNLGELWVASGRSDRAERTFRGPLPLQAARGAGVITEGDAWSDQEKRPGVHRPWLKTRSLCIRSTRVALGVADRILNRQIAAETAITYGLDRPRELVVVFIKVLPL
jgi:hypothetical protein